MLTSTALIAAIAVFSVGAIILRSNPAHAVNRLVFSCSVHIALWMGFIHIATGTRDGLFWLRWATSVSALIPLHFWLVKEAIVSGFDNDGWRGFMRRFVPWVLGAAFLASLPFTEFFIPSHSTPERRLYGTGYYIYIIGVLAAYIAVAVDSLRAIRAVSGGRRLALQVWLWGGCAAAATILLLMMVNAVTRSHIRLQPFVVLVYYAVTAFAITTNRIFDARQLMLIGSSKAILVAVVGAAGFALHSFLTDFLTEWLAFAGTIAFALWFARVVNGYLHKVLNLFPEATSARMAAFTAAQREARVESLEQAFKGVLKGWGQAEYSIVLSGTRESVSGGGVQLDAESPVLSTLRDLQWATPERLMRERATSGRKALGEFLANQSLGIVAISEGPSLMTVVGVGHNASRRPFTYPQVMQLMELASIMESALERAHFSAKVQHTEQLATVGLLGASLAHEIRNPLVSIKTFVQLLPTHHADPRFREKFFRLIGDEVGRIDQLTQQLLDLASPRIYTAELVELHPLLQSSLDLVAAKAAHRSVQLLTQLEARPDQAYTDASAAKQVMLNLCFNAIQAVESATEGERWVKIATRNIKGGIEMEIADSGPGIAPEIRPRLFQPFQTTKSTGFGLGLAICSDILANLNASISVDPPAPGCGATFRVTFPCQPSSS